MVLKFTERGSLLHGTLASFSLLLPNESLLWCQEGHGGALLEDFGGNRKDGQGLKCLGKDSALYHPSKEEQLKLQNPQTHSRHTCTHIQAHLLPENPVPAAPAPSEAAQEWGPHTAVRRGPSGRRHSRGVQGHHSTWRLCRPAKHSPCKAHGQMDQA